MTDGNKNLTVADQGTDDLVAAQMAGAVTTTKKSAIAALIEGIMQEFQEVNDGIDADFVNIASWLVFDKKGNFIVKETKDKPVPVSYGDKIDVVVGIGEKRWQLWGNEGSPEDGKLITAKKEYAEAVAELTAWLEANPQAAERYNTNMLELCYLLFFVPVVTLGPSKLPKIYIMALSKTATTDWGNYMKAVFMGNYEDALGIPERTGVNKLVTRIATAEKSSDKYEWLGQTFEPVGWYRPEDYGLGEGDQAPADAAKKASESDLPG
jgi:hypothetical protein